MKPLAADFRATSEALFQLLEPLPERDFARTTQFKEWTITDVIAHLHMWNQNADLSLSDPDAFRRHVTEYRRELSGGMSRRDHARAWLQGISGRELLARWHDYVAPMAARFAAADPRTRVPWAGPDMSVRSSLTARLMETWAHGQEVFDLLGVVRQDTDSIRHIAVLGVNTYGWTFRNRQWPVPEPAPQVRLTAPSGAIWTWHEGTDGELVQGSAQQFCQVVTQVRNLGDTQLRVVGDNATRWMSVAQCFAGEPNDPPAVGTRFTAAKV